MPRLPERKKRRKNRRLVTWETLESLEKPSRLLAIHGAKSNLKPNFIYWASTGFETSENSAGTKPSFLTSEESRERF